MHKIITLLLVLAISSYVYAGDILSVVEQMEPEQLEEFINKRSVRFR